MLNEFEFREWLDRNKSYSHRVIKDIVCRFNRVEKMLPLDDNHEKYMWELEKILNSDKFSPNVKSQLRKSVKLYFEFLENQISNNRVPKNKIKVGSMFSNIGVAEANLEKIGFSVVVANELEERRAKLYSSIYPNSKMVVGDITKESVFNEFVNISKELNIDVLMATPPCQGMSTAGQQKDDDGRNLLILPVVSAIKKLQPKYVFIENVPMFLKTKIEVRGKKYLITDYLNQNLSKQYAINIFLVDVSDYAVPQTRDRAIILLTRRDLNKEWVMPEKSPQKVTLFDTIGHLPELDPFVKDISELERNRLFPDYSQKRQNALKISRWHTPPHHIYRQVEAMMHTETGRTAFDNEIYYPKKADGTAVKGYRNTYKRQHWNRPAYTVTMDNRKISSQNNVHPGRKYLGKNGEILYSDARTLTLYEIMLIMTLPKSWNLPENAPEAFVRRIIGEGIPPLFVEKVFSQLLTLERGNYGKD